MSRARKAGITVLIVAGFGVASFFCFHYLSYEKMALWALQSVMGRAMAQSSPESRQLLADIRRFRTESAALEPRKAVEAWMALYERARATQFGKVREWDLDTMEDLGMGSVLAALPGPQAWPALREAAAERVKRVPDDGGALGVRYVAEQLTGDRKAAAATLGEIESKAASVKNPNWTRASVAYVRAEAARLYGSREEIASSFVAALEWSARDGSEVEVPDLVGLVGEAKAKAILRAALTKPAGLYVPEGEATRALAWRTALEMIGELKAAQWGLVDGIEAAPLYEALDKRFAGGDKQVEGRRGRGRGTDRKGTADTYYFLYLVINGRNADAEKQLARLGSGLSVPKRALEALGRAGKHEALYRFLYELLARRPEMRVWEVYLREAAYTGHSAEALALVEALLKRQNLGPDLRFDLRLRRANALLAADQVDAGVAELRELLAAPPKQGERTLQARGEAAIRLAGLGRVLERKELSDQGLAFAKAVLALPAADRYDWRRNELLGEILAEQRKQGLNADAETLAKAELAAKPAQGMTPFPGGGMEQRTAAVELASLYGATKRNAEVLALLDESTAWSVRDLRNLMQQKDSLGVPITVIAARALAATGREETAIALARATIAELPGQDAAYELEVTLDKDAHDFLDKMYAADQFEERPLIWKAVLYVRDGRTLEAESVIRRAITIDPSDGEEGPNDRMRAYAVLADVLDARGAKADAALFRRAVAAIRISERSDELHRLGLYQRAFAGYRSALEQFADAYCIQSRLAIRLMEQGRRDEAFQHYRRAYELMPVSFGRVESHCFGCESVFDGDEQKSLAEKVFGELLAKDPKKPQVHYMLGYLQKERGRYPEAVKRFGESVRLDPEYLNAWKHLNDLGARVYIAPAERDAARMKLLALDPQQRHVHYELDSVGDLAQLWGAVEKAYAASKPGEAKSLYRLKASAATIDAGYANLPAEAREQMSQFENFDYRRSDRLSTPPIVLGKHRLMRASAALADPPN